MVIVIVMVIIKTIILEIPIKLKTYTGRDPQINHQPV